MFGFDLLNDTSSSSKSTDLFQEQFKKMSVDSQRTDLVLARSVP